MECRDILKLAAGFVAGGMMLAASAQAAPLAAVSNFERADKFTLVEHIAPLPKRIGGLPQIDRGRYGYNRFQLRRRIAA